MTTPGGGGDRLEVGVVVDATGFSEDAQRKIDAELKRNEVRAKIKADLDFRRLQAQAEAAVKRISKQTQMRLQLGVDKNYLLRSLDQAVAEANARNHAVKIKVDVDRQQLDAALDSGGPVSVSSSVLPSGGGGGPSGAPARVPVLVETAQGKAQVAAFRAREESDPIDVVVNVDQKSVRSGGRGIRILTQNMSGLQKAGFYAGLVQTLASAAVGAGAGLFAMASAASQASGVLLALPNAVGVAVQGLGSLLAGFSGVGAAVSELGKAQASGGAQAAQAARAQEQAQRSIARAREAVADAAEAGARRIAQAERGLADAQKASVRAQEAVNRARKEATEQLADYRLELAGAALDEEGAILAVERAKEAWNKAMRNPASTALDRKEADLSLRQAEQSLKEIQERNADLREEAAAADVAGVEGAAAVVAAKDDVISAAEAEAEAERDLAEARIDSAEGLRDAQQNLADALADASAQMAAQAAAAAAMTQAMDKLSPAGQEFARFLDGTMKPRMLEFRNGIQQQLLPGVQDALEALNTDPDPGTGLGSYLDVLQGGMERSGWIMGQTAKRAGELMQTPGFRADTATIMDSNNRALQSFSNAGLSLVNVFRNLAVAAGPLIERFANFIEQKAALLDTFVSTSRESGKLADFMTRAGDRASQLGNIVANLVKILFHMGKAGTESGDSLLDKLEKLTEKWERWTRSSEGQDRMAKFFETMQPLFEAMGGTISRLAEAFVALGENGGGSITGLFWAVNLLLDVLIWLLESPIGPFISAFMAFAGVASVLSLVGGMVMGMVGSIGSLLAMGGRIVKLIQGVGFALRILAMTNPFTLILVGIIAAVAAFVWLYNNVEWFRNGVNAALDWVKMAAETAFNWIKDNWPLLLGILTGPFGLAIALIVNYWDEIKAAGKAVFDWVSRTAKSVWDKLPDGLKGAVNTIIGFLNKIGVGGLNLLLGGINKIPGVNIPKIPEIPKLAEGAIVRRPTLAMIGEAGDEVVLPLSASRADRRNELMEQAGLMPRVDDARAVAGWGRLDSLSGNSSLAELVATSGGAIDSTTDGGNRVGVLIQEGAVQQIIHNPVPETASGTLNSGLRRVAAAGIFGGGPT